MIQASLRNRVVIEFNDPSIPDFVCGEGVTPMAAAMMVKQVKRFIDKHMAIKWIERCREAINKGCCHVQM